MSDQSQYDQDRLLQLISRCALKGQDTFKALYQLTSAKLFGVALRILKQEARAEEALQESCLKIWRNAADYSSQRGRPMTWLISIVRNQSLDMLRAGYVDVGKAACFNLFGAGYWVPSHEKHLVRGVPRIALY